MAGVIFGLMYAKLGSAYRKVIISTCVVGPVLGAILLLVFLWLRNKFENSKEEAKDKQTSSNDIIQKFDKFSEKFEIFAL